MSVKPPARAVETGVLAAVPAAGAVFAAAGSARAADGTLGERETVCAQDLFVRTAPTAGNPGPVRPARKPDRNLSPGPLASEN